MRAFHWVAAFALAGLCAGTAAHADNTGIYAGFSLGQARTDFSDEALDDLFDGEDTAFKLFLGYRVLDWVGFEAGYVDLGEIAPRGNLPAFSQVQVDQAGFNVFGVLYWDIANVDLFAKGGFMLSQVRARTNTFFGTFDNVDNSTDLAWGVGAQVRFGKLAVRLEYERFDFDAGVGLDTPEMVSLGATWTFF
jgi:opacity protein-like surface antigen